MLLKEQLFIANQESSTEDSILPIIEEYKKLKEKCATIMDKIKARKERKE